MRKGSTSSAPKRIGTHSPASNYPAKSMICINLQRPINDLGSFIGAPDFSLISDKSTVLDRWLGVRQDPPAVRYR